MRLLIFFLMLGTASLALAQEQAPNPTHNRRPRTRTEFLQKYGANDTAVAIINVFFQNRLFRTVNRATTGTLAAGTGLLVLAANSAAEDDDDVVAIGGSIFFAFTAVLTGTLALAGVTIELVTLPHSIKHSKRNLFLVLEGKKQLSEKQWRKVRRWMEKNY